MDALERLRRSLPPLPQKPPPYRRGSVDVTRCPPAGTPLTFFQRAYVMAYAGERSAAHAPRLGQRWGYLTPADFGVLNGILHFTASGTPYPTYETLARLADCDDDTVGEAIKRLKELGIIDWINRKANERQTSNLYSILIKPPAGLASMLEPNPGGTPKDSVFTSIRPRNILEMAIERFAKVAGFLIPAPDS